MGEHVNGTHRDQTVLFPNTIDQYVDKENPVRSSTHSSQPQALLIIQDTLKEAFMHALYSCPSVQNWYTFEGDLYHCMLGDITQKLQLCQPLKNSTKKLLTG